MIRSNISNNLLDGPQFFPESFFHVSIRALTCGNFSISVCGMNMAAT